MINGKTILAIIPARGGSKGIPRKNIKFLAGKPLIAWTIEEAKKSKFIDRLILSTEDEEIINVAKEYGCEVPFVRPKDLAQDNIPGVEPVLHAIKTLHVKYDYICLLQPTSPLRRVEHIDACIEKCVNNNAKSCVSVTEVDKHPYWMYSMNKDSILQPMFSKESLIDFRQNLSELFIPNGAIYMICSSLLISSKSFFNEETIAYIMLPNFSVDIDTQLDFDICEFLFSKLLYA